MNAIENLRWYVGVCVDFGEIDKKLSKDFNEYIDSIKDEYMELPRDKNGEVVHVGDWLERRKEKVVIESIGRHGTFTDSSGVFHNTYCWELVNPKKRWAVEQE